jgi:hypothetical protein
MVSKSRAQIGYEAYRESLHRRSLTIRRTTWEELSQNLKDAWESATLAIIKATIPKEAISEVMSAFGHKGGKIGGKRRMQTLTPERRREIASQAARKRWHGKEEECGDVLGTESNTSVGADAVSIGVNSSNPVGR